LITLKDRPAAVR